MAQSVTARAAGRGFPVFDRAGQSGAGALPDSSAPPPRTGLPTGQWADPNTDPASVPAQLPPPEDYVLGPSLWGLGAAANPDDTPRTHAAPFADPAALALGDGGGLHGAVFNGPAERRPVALATMRQGRDGGQGSSADTLQPLAGQIRSNAGYDAVQGYGGGGPGPGGVNSVQGPATDLTTWGGETYHNVTVNAAEVAFLTAGGDQFVVTAPEFPSYMPTYDVPTASVSAQDAVGTDTPAQGPALGAGSGVAAASFWS